jgi:hypothetical protein
MKSVSSEGINYNTRFAEWLRRWQAARLIAGKSRKDA